MDFFIIGTIIVTKLYHWFGQKIALVYCQRCNIYFQKQLSIILFCFIWVSKNLCTDFTDLSWHHHIWPSVKQKLVLPSPPLFCYNWQHNTFSCAGPLEPMGKGGNPSASTPLRFWKQYQQNLHIQKTLNYHFPGIPSSEALSDFRPSNCPVLWWHWKKPNLYCLDAVIW